jgi:hypothetical protein
MSISYDRKFGCTHKIAMPWDKGGKSISWKLRITKPGIYRLISDQAFAPGLEGARYQILINDQKFESLPITSKNGRDFIEVEVGSVNFDAPGDYELRMVMLDGARLIKGASRDKSGQYSEFSLRMIKLSPSG